LDAVDPSILRRGTHGRRMATDDVDRFRGQITDWILSKWSADMTLRQWWWELYDAGLAFPTWPVGLGGRELSGDLAGVVRNELATAGAIGPPGGNGTTMAAPTLLRHGTETQIKKFLPALAKGTEAWCQLFSEPGAGSDLASLQTTAVQDGDEWIVNGQKVWTTAAHLSTRGFLLARTTLDAPKHEGITYFVIDVDQPGVEVRPLRQINGVAEFNEVFFTDARIPPGRVIGEVNRGWAVAMTTLGFERMGAGRGGARGLVHIDPGEKTRNLDRPVGELVAAERAKSGRSRVYALSSRRMIELARRMGRAGDPIIRQRLAEYYSMTEVHRFNTLRAQAASRLGRAPGSEASLAKLTISNIARTSRALSLDLLGPAATLVGTEAPEEGAVADMALSSFAAGLGGGTDEIQRNLVGERALGLPREPQLDRDIPFRELRVGTQVKAG
jgi:alkylation response protein AidB-like acyl-CoA dehydrogenase